jgi:hypothetical protein
MTFSSRAQSGQCGRTRPGCIARSTRCRSWARIVLSRRVPRQSHLSSLSRRFAWTPGVVGAWKGHPAGLGLPERNAGHLLAGTTPGVVPRLGRHVGYVGHAIRVQPAAKAPAHISLSGANWNWDTNYLWWWCRRVPGLLTPGQLRASRWPRIRAAGKSIGDPTISHRDEHGRRT